MRMTETAHESELPASTRLFDFLSRICLGAGLLLFIPFLLLAAVFAISFFMFPELFLRVFMVRMIISTVPHAAPAASPDPFWVVVIDVIYAYIIPILFVLGLFFWFLSRAGKSWREGDVVAAPEVEVTKATPNTSAALRRRRRRQR